MTKQELRLACIELAGEHVHHSCTSTHFNMACDHEDEILELAEYYFSFVEATDEPDPLLVPAGPIVGVA